MSEPSPDWPKLLSLLDHELRTPAGVVAGYLRMLLQGRSGDLTDAQRKLAEAADRSSARLAEILGELAELAKLEAAGAPLTSQTVALSELLSPLQQSAAGSDAAITIHGEIPDVDLHADVTRLRAALAALASAERRDQDETAAVAVRAWTEGRKDHLDVLVAVGSPDIIREVGHNVRATRLPFDCWRVGRGLAVVLAARVVALHDGAIWTLATRPGSSVTLVRLPETSSQAA